MNYIFKNKNTDKYFNFDRWLQNQNLSDVVSKTDVDNLKDASIYHNGHGNWLIINNYPYIKIKLEEEIKNIRKLKIKKINEI